MKKVMMMLAVSGVVAAPMSLVAHEGHTHTTLGTIDQIAKDRLDVKGTDGKVVSFTLNDDEGPPREGGGESRWSEEG